MPALPSARPSPSSRWCDPSCASPRPATRPGCRGPHAARARTARRPLPDADRSQGHRPPRLRRGRFGHRTRPGGRWRLGGPSKPGDNAPRRVIAIDPALDKDARGTALGKEARRLDVAISDRYTEALAEADLVISAVQGEHALDAATSAARFLKKGATFLDLCTVTGKLADED